MASWEPSTKGKRHGLLLCYQTKRSWTKCWHCSYDGKSPILSDLNKIEYGIRPHRYTVHMKQNKTEQLKTLLFCLNGVLTNYSPHGKSIVLGNKEHGQAPSFAGYEWKCCIRVTTAELSSCDREIVTCKA